MRVNIYVTFTDLAKLAADGKVEEDGNTLSVSRTILPHVEISADGLRGFVRFTVDESDPLSLPPQEAKLPGRMTYINSSIPRTKRD